MQISAGLREAIVTVEFEEDADEQPEEWFAAWYRLDGEDRFLLWWQDGVFADSDQRVPAFQTLADLEAFARELGITRVDEDPSLHDLDLIEKWLFSPDRESIDCNRFINSWNLFDNVANSIHVTFPPDEKSQMGVYHMLFWGCNLPAMTPPGEHYDPDWTDNDVATIAEVLSFGLHMFRNAIRPA